MPDCWRGASFRDRSGERSTKGNSQRPQDQLPFDDTFRALVWFHKAGCDRDGFLKVGRPKRIHFVAQQGILLGLLRLSH